MNDIIHNINDTVDGLFTTDDVKIYLILFVDEMILFAHEQEALQSMLNDLNKYCTTWDLSVNTKKTQTMTFKLGNHTTNNFIFDNTVLENVKSFKYLGVTLYKRWSLVQNSEKKNLQTCIICDSQSFYCI